jgi:hypothetical protein
MRTAFALDQTLIPMAAGFDLPPQFPAAEQRLSGRALKHWLHDRHHLVPGHDDNSIVIAEPDGMATIASVGDAVATTFGLAAGMRLDGRAGLAGELRAACDLISVDLRPVPFEASLSAPGRPCILARGVALPIGPAMEQVQIIVSWREVLDRSATRRLRREIGVALQFSPGFSPPRDPFSAEMAR